MTDQQAAQDWHLGQQAAWLIRRCSQLRPWLQHDRPDVVDACRAALDDLDPTQLGAAHLVQACQALDTALHTLGCPRLVWSSRQGTQAGPWIGCAPLQGWFIVHARQADGHWLLETPQGSVRCPDLPDHARLAPLPLSAGWTREGSMRTLVRQTLQDNRAGLMQVAACSITVNVLLLATSLYSMQVYDRVIPSHGLSTLVTLTVGVLLAISMELLTKLARSALMDHNIQAMDSTLSRQVFERLLRVRLDQFPPSIGTLSSQLRSYEMIRSFVSSIALYTLVDAPFALVFLAIMVMIGGGMVAGVAAVFLLLSLAVGLLARSRIEAHTRLSMAASNRKLGLLVETVEGAERIKSQGSGWTFLNRWNALSEQGIAEDAKVRHSSESATYWAGFLQQVSYVMLIAVGAWIASTTSDLTSGGLIACSIISGRVLAPIGSLPGLIVQWANAQSALDSLERIFLLRCDNDGVEQPLEREDIRGQLEVQDLGFGYGSGPRVLSLTRWSVMPGERVAVLGLVPSLAGFTVSGDTTIEAGGTIKLQLLRDGAVMANGLGGTITSDGRWSVRFTGNAVKNLTDGNWQLVASGVDSAGNAAANPERSRAFTVDSLASVNFDPISSDGKVNLSDDGSTLVVSGTYADIDAGHTLSLTLRDTGPGASGASGAVVWSQPDIPLLAADSTTGSWRYDVSLLQWDALLQAGLIQHNPAGVANLMLTATVTDTAGNVAENYAAFTLDRSVPAAPALGWTQAQIVGDTSDLQPPAYWSRASTVADSSQGMVLAPQASPPTDADIACIRVHAVSAEVLTDGWRLANALCQLNTSVSATSVTIDADAFNVTYTYDAALRELNIRLPDGAAFTPLQVQQVLAQLAWVNTATDQGLDQMPRVFTVQYLDMHANVSEASTVTFSVDTAQPAIAQITSANANSRYKANDTISLSLWTDEDIADAGSSLLVTLNTGTPGPSGVSNSTVTMTRDAINPRLFTGTYTVQAGDTSADLDVIQVSWYQIAGSQRPRDAAGNLMNVSVSSLPLASTLSGNRDIVIDTTPPTAIDLVAGGALDTSRQVYYTGAMAGGNLALMDGVGHATESDIATLSLAINGADALNDVLEFGGVSLALNGTAQGGAIQVGSMGVDWTYSAARVLTFTRTGGGAWTPDDIHAFESSWQFRTYLAAQMGSRTFTLTHADLIGNVSAASTQTVIVDAVAPNAPDLDAFTNGIQRTGDSFYGGADVGSSKAIAPRVDASQGDIAHIIVTVGGVADAADQLTFGEVTQLLNPNAAASGSNITINGVAGIDWSYSTAKVLTLTRTAGGAFTATQVRDLERGLNFKTAPGVTNGARTFTWQNIDAAGNTSAASTQTFNVDALAPVVSAVAIQGTTLAGIPKSILGVGDQVRVDLTMSEPVVVNTALGTPTYSIVLDSGGTVMATYAGGSGSNRLTFSYTVAPTNNDSAGGVTVPASPLSLNGATLQDLAGNACSLASLPAPPVNTLKVDTSAPAPVTNMVVLDTNLPASTGGTVKVLNSSLFQILSARAVHFGYNNTSTMTIKYRQDDGSFLTFSFTDSTTYSAGVSTLISSLGTSFDTSSLGQANLFDLSMNGSSGLGYSTNAYSNLLSSGDNVARTIFIFLQAKPGKLIDASRLSFSSSFYYWLPSTAAVGNLTNAVTYDQALAWGNSPPPVPGNAQVYVNSTTLSSTQQVIGGHINSGSSAGNGWLYHYQGVALSTPAVETDVGTVADNRLVFDFSSVGGIGKSTVLSTVTAGEGRLSATDASTVLTFWRSKFTPASGALPTFAEMFGAATTYVGTSQKSTTTGGEGYMVSYEYMAGSSSLVSKVVIDLGVTSNKSKLLGGKFTFGSTVLKLPTTWANDGGVQTNALPTFDITLPAGVEEGSLINVYDGTTSTGTLIGSKYLTAAEVASGFASLPVSADRPFANVITGPVTHSLSVKVTDNAGNVSTNDGFYNYQFRDVTGPAVRSVKVWGATAAGSAKAAPLVTNDQVMVTLVWDEAPVVTGQPTYTLNVNGVARTATYVRTDGKEMLLAYTVGASDSSVGISASASALTLGNGDIVQDAVGNAANLATPAVAAIDHAVVLANPRGGLTGEQLQALAAGDSQPSFALSYDGSRAQAGDQLVLLENGVTVGSRLLTQNDIGAGTRTLLVNTDNSLLPGTHAITFQYLDNTGAATPYTIHGSAATEYVTLGAHAMAPSLTLDAIQVNNEGRQPARSLSDGSTYQSTSAPDLVFTGTVNQDATVTVLATSTTTGAVQTVGTQLVLANQTYSITETPFSLAPDMYRFKVQAQNTTGQVSAVSTGQVGVFATATGSDTLLGTAGNDRINAGEGTNTVSTGGGQDIVYLGGYLTQGSNTGVSSTTITDFKVGQDKLDLTGVFAPGTVNSSNLLQFVSQSVSGGDTTLSIDSNGSAAGGTIHTVILKNVTQVPLDSTVFNYTVL